MRERFRWSSFTTTLTGSLASFLMQLCTLGYAITPISPHTSPLEGFENCILGPTNNPTPSLLISNDTYNPLIAVNPEKPNLLIAPMSQGFFRLNTASPFTIGNPEISIAHSKNGGESWEHTVIPLNICLGGHVSDSNQVTSIVYSPRGTSEGTAFLGGTFNDVRSGIHNQDMSGAFVCMSKDGGKTWSEPTVLAAGTAFNSPTVRGPNITGVSLALSPFEHSAVYASWDTIDLPTTFFGDIYFNSSNNLGESWQETKKIYSIVQDFPDSAYASLGGGQAIGPALAVSKKGKQKVIVDSFLRIYPINMTPNGCYSQNIGCDECGITPHGAICTPKGQPDSIYDRALVRSLDGGATWEEHAIVIAPINFASSFDPRNPSIAGVTVFDNALGNSIAVDKKKGTIYVVWQAGHITNDPRLLLQPQIFLSLSKDLGQTWTPPVVVSRTTEFGALGTADQAFNANITVTDEGLVAISYYDFRNFQTGSNAALTDAWLDIYKPDSKGGSTGVGLDFVQELRLSPQSFDSGPSYVYPVRKFFADNGCPLPFIIPQSRGGIGSQAGITSAAQKIFTSFGMVRTGFDPFLISIGNTGPASECSPINTSTRVDTLLDYNTYLECFFEEVSVENIK